MMGKKQHNPFNHSILHPVVFVVNTTLVLLAINVISQNLAVFDYTFSKLLTILLLLALTIMNLPFSLSNSWKESPFLKQLKQLLPGILLIFFAFGIVIVSSSFLLWMVAIPLSLLGIIGLNKAMNKSMRKDIKLLTIYTFIYTIFTMILTTTPILWHFFVNCSLTITKTIGVITGIPLFLGPSISGLTILLTFLLFQITLLFAIKNKKPIINRFLISITSLFIIWISYLIYLNYTELQASVSTIQYHPLLFICFLIPTAVVLITIKATTPLSINIQPHFFSTDKQRQILILLITVFLATLFMTYQNIPSTSDKPTVLWYGTNMLGDWDIPVYGTYGREAAGMFGLLPLYLNAMGYSNKMIVTNTTSFLNTTKPAFQNITSYVNITDYVTLIETTYVSKSLLDTVEVFAVINPNATFSIPEKEQIWNFVESGGSLLVLGDHTNVGETMQPLNDLLSPVKISYRFDSALPLDQQFQWKTSGQLHPHIITHGLHRVQDLDISVGASLETTIQTVPVVIGRYALSDNGDWSNKDFAYLGDYDYNDGEQLGDIVLVASTNYGDGKVLVFGDSSPFQNSAIPFTHPSIQNVFTWLSTPANTTAEFLQPLIAIILLVAAFLFYLSIKTPKPTVFPLPITIAIALLITTIHPIIAYNPIDFQGNIVAIDTSHTERFTIKPFTDQSLNGFMLSLQRNNLLPIINTKFDIDQLSKTKIIVFNAPTKPFTQNELNFLNRYMSQGGVVILATSYEDKEASQQLLTTYDLDIENIPLGPVPYIEKNPEEYETQPRFVDSWPIQFNPETTISFYNFTWNRDYHLITYTTIGLGGLLLISDSQFLQDSNIESLYDFWPGNIILLKHLIDQILDSEENP